MSPTPSTRVARGTPEGPGAIASLFVAGPQAWELVRQHLRCSRRLPEIPKDHETVYGWFHGTDSELADEVVVLIHTPHKIELQGHGGKRNRDWMLEVLAQSGAEIVDWRMLLPAFEEWADPRAVEPLTRAVTDRVASILLDQANGAFLRECQLIEAAIKNGDVALARAKIRTLAEAIPLGERLRSWKWLLAGPPNVGKSQLANALVGYERSIVSPIPGTTRDVVTTPLAVGGFPVELLDTAGLRATTNALEAEGISRTRAQFAGADVVIWLLDGSAAQPEFPEESIHTLAKDKLQFVINKSDLPAQSWVENYPAIPRLSARTRSGVKEWLALLEQQTPAALPLGAPVPYLPEFQQAIATLNSLMTGSDFPTEAILTTLQVCTGGSLVRS